MVYVLGVDLSINDGADQMENCFSISYEAHRVQLNFGGQYRWDNFTFVKKLQVKTNIQYSQDQNISILMLVRKRQWLPTPVLLPGKSHGWRSLVGCSPWGREESETTEWLHFHFSLSCIGEGNGNPLQCSCLESPRDGGAWWAAVYGVTESQTRLKRLSSSSSSQE